MRTKFGVRALKFSGGHPVFQDAMDTKVMLWVAGQDRSF